MSWTDRIATEEILKLRDKFSIKTFIETGTFKGANAKFHAHNFKEVLSCDNNREYFRIAGESVKGYKNVKLYFNESDEFLRYFVNEYRMNNRKDTVFIYLDAHFYDSKLPPEKKWVVVTELKALRGFVNCVLCIHDFDCGGLGHLVYDNEPLGWQVVKGDILKVNQNFQFYVNEREYCAIYNEETIKGVVGITLDEGTIDMLKYANSSDEKRYRGILYAVPEELDLNVFRFKKLEAK